MMQMWTHVRLRPKDVKAVNHIGKILEAGDFRVLLVDNIERFRSWSTPIDPSYQIIYPSGAVGGYQGLLLNANCLGRFLYWFREDFDIIIEHGPYGPIKSWYPFDGTLDPVQETLILNGDIQSAIPTVREEFARNLLFLYLNSLEDLRSTEVLKVLDRSVQEWLDLFGNTTVIPDSCGLRLQMISIFRLVFEYSGGSSDSVQEIIRPFQTMKDNAALCARYLGAVIDPIHPFGLTPDHNVVDALQQSKVFRVSNTPIRQLGQWRHEMMYRCLLALPTCQLPGSTQLVSVRRETGR
ncbi:MAG: hypothetical protein Q9171_002925 [Xanthocarpia ochracea]